MNILKRYPGVFIFGSILIIGFLIVFFFVLDVPGYLEFQLRAQISQRKQDIERISERINSLENTSKEFQNIEELNLRSLTYEASDYYYLEKSNRSLVIWDRYEDEMEKFHQLSILEETDFVTIRYNPTNGTWSEGFIFKIIEKNIEE